MRKTALLLMAFGYTLIAIAACETLGLQPAESFNDRAAYALGIHTGVLESATVALDAERISSEEAESFLETADNARGFIDSARAIHQSGQVGEATRKLSMATTILRELQTYLRGDP